MSAGKPLGSRAVVLLDLDFSFLGRERKAQTQCQKNTCCSRGDIPLSVYGSPEGCAQVGLCPWLWGHIPKWEAKIHLQRYWESEKREGVDACLGMTPSKASPWRSQAESLRGSGRGLKGAQGAQRELDSLKGLGRLKGLVGD